MRARGAPLTASLLVIALVSASCSGRGLVRQFEYEEELRLAMDGSAEVIVNASMPALAALRGFPVDPNPRARVDRNEIRSLFESPVTRVTRVSRPWRRAGRRFIQVRVETEDVRRLGRAKAFAWSSYGFTLRDGVLTYRQRIGPAAGEAPNEVNWTGGEMVAFRMHLPSRIEYHNAPSREVERGNILSWHQPLAERLAGRPIEIEVRMDEESILRRTLLVFAIAVSAALILLGSIVWWVHRKGRAQQQA